MAFQVGDIVKVIDEPGEGRVISVSISKVVVDIDGFEFPFHPTELLKVLDGNQVVHKTHEKAFSSILQKPSPSKNTKKPFAGKYSTTFIKNRRGIPEIDLHIHELIDRPQDYNNTEKLQIQLSHLDHFIQWCSEKSQSECVVIHGVGEGVLKSEIRHRLKTFEHVDFWDADFSEYGFGATHVKIHGLFR